MPKEKFLRWDSMEISLHDARFFKQCLDAIVNLVDEGSFSLSKEGMSLRTIDPSLIAMVDFFLPKEAFKKLETDEAQSLGLNLVDLSKVLARVRGDEQLHLKLSERESRILLEFIGKNKRHFKLPLLDLSAQSPKEPKVEFDATIKIRGGAFKEMLKDAGLLSSHVILEATPEMFVVEAHGDSGDLVAETEKKSEDIEEFTVNSKSRAMYPFEYLDDMTRACPDDSVIEIGLKTDAPVKISYEIGKAKISYFLAPRVENY